MNTIFSGKIKGIGVLTIIIGKNGVELVKFGTISGKFSGRSGKNAWKKVKFNTKIRKWFGSYTSKKPKKFPYKPNFSGTPFQIAVWRAIMKIPYGQVRNYKWIAEKIGKPKAVRAVGNACGANPLPIIIPCHRVVASTGLGGFSGGLQIKKRLLKLEAGETFPLP